MCPRACAGVVRAPTIGVLSPSAGFFMTDSSARLLSRTPSLYVVATPLGNLGDISERAQGILAAVDVIAAEDTRHSQRLLEACGVRTRLVAVHQHNEQRAAGQLVEWLAADQHVALITDAGTPAVSDPGAKVVARVREAGYPVVPVPGAC
ncbi:MAG: SAM-dependent methyltransferase, partial [Azoarcus sp.]|nr:SAM-dependent methyltransferase [Azoarcus sp.]